MLIHKMAKRNYDSVKVKDSADPNKWGNLNNNPWPVMSNPYVPKNNNPAQNWGSSNPWGNTGPVSMSSKVMTAEDMKKKEKAAKQYRSIDDPWEPSEGQRT